MAESGLYKDEFKLIGPQDDEYQPLSAVTLSCHLSPEISAISMEIRWFKGTDCVCLYKNRQVTEGRGYEGRVSLFTQDLEKGNVSLQIRACRESDTGDYLCQVFSGDTSEECTVGLEESSTQAQVVSVSQSDRKWTEKEKKKMRESALLTELKETQEVITERDAQLKEREKEAQEKHALLTENAEALQVKDKVLKDKLLTEVKTKLGQRTKKSKENQKETKERSESVTEQLKDKNEQLENMSKLLTEKEALLEKMVEEVNSSRKHLDNLRKELQDKSRKLQKMMFELEQQKTELTEKEQQFEEKEKLLSVPVRRRNSKDFGHPNLGGVAPAPQLKRRKSITGLPPRMSGESSGAASPEPVPLAELRLVLLGRSGYGKSEAGNIILGREEKIQAGGSTERQQSESRQGEVGGRKVTVVETPDWFCPELSLEDLRQDVGLCVRLSAPGPHAFLLVVPVKSSTGEKGRMLEKIEEIFGERCWRNTMVLFTFNDEAQEKNPEKFVRSGNQEVQRLVEKCGYRFYCLGINESADGSKISELLEKIEEMVGGNRQKIYSSEIYLETESQIRAMETKIMKEKEEKREREEKEIKKQLEKELKNSLKKIEEVIHEHDKDIKQLNDRTTELERKMTEERNEEKRKELEIKLQQQNQQRAEMEEKVKRLKEKREKEKREMEERHEQEMEAIRETYEGEAIKKAERNLMKIILPELQRNISASKSKMKEEFSRQMEDKDRDLETLKQKLSDLTKTHSLLEEVYETTLKRSDTERAAPAAEGGSKGIFQTLMGLFSNKKVLKEE